MGNPKDYYAILGLSPAATLDEIRRAYRTHAKSAHPDAGGAPDRMEALNVAYRVLSDSTLRREYDQSQIPQPITDLSPDRPADPPYAPPPHYQSSARTSSPDPDRLSRARSSAWRITRFGMIAAIVFNIVSSFAPSALHPTMRFMLNIITFIPIYAIVIGLLFLISPKIRLDLYDTIHGPRHHLTRPDYLILLALGLSFIPLALVWIHIILPAM